MATSDNNVIREGISAGLIGATAIALWFAIIDLVQGEMFATPITLGTSLGSIFFGGDPPSRAGAFIGYTLFHFALFAVIGIVLSWVVNSSERTSGHRVSRASVAFEGGRMAPCWRRAGSSSWLQVFAAN